MSQRTVLCSRCYGAKADDNGYRCIDCNGVGTFLYGEDRDPEAVQVELIQCRGILEQCCLELYRWEWSKERPEELIDLDGRVVPAKLKEAVDYWKFQVERLEKELRECIPKEGGSDGKRSVPDEASRVNGCPIILEGTRRSVPGTRKVRVRSISRPDKSENLPGIAG